MGFGKVKQYVIEHKKQIAITGGILIGSVILKHFLHNNVQIKGGKTLTSLMGQQEVGHTFAEIQQTPMVAHTYHWKESGHIVHEHFRNYKNGRRVLIREYYKPTGGSLVA